MKERVENMGDARAEDVVPSIPGEVFGDWLQEVGVKVRYGIPLTLSEQRRLFALVSGRVVWRHKRCGTCDGEGKVNIRCLLPNRESLLVPCHACDGTGYERQA